MNTPIINVNLSRCPLCGPAIHPHGCSGTPVPIPCPIPRSVTFEVVMGECTCPPQARGVSSLWPSGHAPACPNRPIKVSCSISGKTWEESGVVDVERSVTNDRIMGDHRMGLLADACRDRWALVKALVLGQQAEPAETEPVRSMLTQRDAVFSALADMARAEESIDAAQRAFFGVLHGHGKTIVRIAHPSHSLMETYVERLVEQVGVMS